MTWIEEILHDIAGIKQAESDLRKFGLTVGGIIVVIAGFAYWKSWWILDAVLIVEAAGLLLIAAGSLSPFRLKILHKYWMAFAVILGSIVSRIILFILFFLIVTPLSILAKAFGKKFFISYKDTTRSSYWTARDNNKPINYERMN